MILNYCLQTNEIHFLCGTIMSMFGYLKIKMEKTTRIVFFVKKLFWWLNMPCLGMVSAYCIATHQNALESLLFNFTACFCFPYLFVRVEEYKQKAMKGRQDSFSQMTDEQVLDMYRQSDALPMSQQKVMHQEVLKRELERRFGELED